MEQGIRSGPMRIPRTLPHVSARNQPSGSVTGRFMDYGSCQECPGDPWSPVCPGSPMEITGHVEARMMFALNIIWVSLFASCMISMNLSANLNSCSTSAKLEGTTTNTRHYYVVDDGDNDDGD